MTWTLCTSPAARAALAPASTAARTLPTSPVTYTEHRPLPTLDQPTNLTLAALSIASVACTRATRPLVSIIPIASFAMCDLRPLQLLQHAFDQRIVGPCNHVRRHQLPDYLGRGCARIDRRAYRAHIATNDGCNIAAADLDGLHKLHAGGFHHGVARLDQS